jgi:hypothetical protein
MSNSTWLLQDSNRDETGIEVELEVLLPQAARQEVEESVPSTAPPRQGQPERAPLVLRSPSDAEVLPGHSFRVVPLLALLEADDALIVAVGQVRVQGRTPEVPSVSVVLGEVWQAPVGGLSSGATRSDRSPRGWIVDAEHPRMLALLVAHFNKTSAIVRTRSRDADNPGATASEAEQVTALAKGLAEQSRNSVRQFRDIRYRMERDLGSSLRGAPDAGLNILLADVVDLSLASGRARDEAREAVREGLWAWRNPEEEPTYQALRRQIATTLTSTRETVVARDVPWYRDYEAGVAQARAMDELLAEEVVLLHSLLDSASTISVARDAKAQEDFNFVAAVGGVGLGLLALNAA